MASAGLHTAASGVISYQSALDIAANNMANVNTNGFKASRASFSDLLYTRWRQNERVDRGHGVRIDKTDLMFEQSQLRETGRVLDFAALDEGFFAVENNGRVLYTKDGNFNMTQDEAGGGAWYLCDWSGGYVLDYDGQRVTVPFIGETSEIDAAALRDAIGVYAFENPYGLDQIGSNYFEANDSSGEAAANQDLKKLQGYVEASSTNIANEMSKVIEFQRAFQLNSTMVKTHDEISGTINNLRN